MWTLILACATTRALDAVRPYAGRFDSVYFTAEEAEAILDFVNHASLTTLDDAVGLHPDAADRIVHRRPVPDLLELSQVPYLGEVGMSRLKAYALAETAVVDSE